MKKRTKNLVSPILIMENDINIADELDAIKIRLNQLECPHKNVKFEEDFTNFTSVLYPFQSGQKICVDCNKVLKTYETETLYLEAVIEYRKQNLVEHTEKYKKRTTELEKELKGIDNGS